MSLQMQSDVDAEINAQLASNDTGAITAAALRNVLHDMNATIFQIASSQGLAYSVFRYGAAGDGSTNDAAAFNGALAANAYVVAPTASYAIQGPAVAIPSGATLETYPGAALSYSGTGTLLISPGGAFVTKTYGDQHDGWLWARSTTGTRSSTQDPLGLLGRTGSFNFAFVTPADNGQTPGIVNNLVTFQQFGGTSVTGAREAFLGYLYQTNATSSSNPFRDYVGSVFIVETSSGDGGTLGAEQGAYFGGNSQSRLNAGAAHVLNATAHEFDVYNAAGCTVRWNWGINIASFNAVQGSSNDAAIVIYSGNSAPSNGNTYGPGVGFHNGLCFAEIAATGLPPVDAGATLIGTHFETLATFNAAYGVDLRGFTFANWAFASHNFHVDGVGNITGPSLTGGTLANNNLTLTSNSNANPSGDLLVLRGSTIYFQNAAAPSNLTYGIFYPSGGLFIGSSASDPGAENLKVQGGVTATTVAATTYSFAQQFVGSVTGGGGANAPAGGSTIDGLFLQNTMAATSSVQQDSPNIHLQGQGWNTSALASQRVDWIMTAVPVAGNPPTSQLSFGASINAGSYILAMQLTSQGYLGIGSTVFADSPITVNSNTVVSPGILPTGTLAHFVGGNGTGTAKFVFDAFGTAANFQSRRADTTAASPSAVQSGEGIFTFSGVGWGTTGWSAAAAQLNFVAAENFSDTTHGAYIAFSTSAPGGGALTERLRINASGGIGIGTTTDPGAGNLAVAGTAAASSTATGALTVAGGIGVAGTSCIAGIIATASGGLQVGTPTGGDPGAGKINVSGGIYLNNTAYTNPDYVFEKHFTGKIERFADKPGAARYRGRLSIEALERHVVENLRFPGIDDAPTDIFERGDIALEKLEETALYLFELNARIGRLERATAGRA
jgi:hypothetical protein